MKLFGIVAAFFFGWCLAFYLPGCAAAKQEEAEAVHLGQLGACVDRNTTRTAIDACRAEVEKSWGRLPDGGRMSDGGPE